MQNSKILFIGVVIISSFFAFISAIEQKWKLDIQNSNIGFSVKHLESTEIKGYFEKAECVIGASNSDFANAKVVMQAKTNSVKTNDVSLDKEIKGSDFFNTKEYPDLSFESTSFTKTELDNVFQIEGNLKLKGKTKLIKLTASLKPGEKPSFLIQGKIKRSDFDMGTGVPESVLAEDIDIIANAVFVLQ